MPSFWIHFYGYSGNLYNISMSKIEFNIFVVKRKARIKNFKDEFSYIFSIISYDFIPSKINTSLSESKFLILNDTPTSTPKPNYSCNAFYEIPKNVYNNISEFKYNLKFEVNNTK